MTPNTTFKRYAGLTEVMLTGGLPPCIDSSCAADEAYRHLFPRVQAQNRKFYKRFPGDVARAQAIVKYLAAQPEGGLRLPNGDLLTPRYYQAFRNKAHRATCEMRKPLGAWV